MRYRSREAECEALCWNDPLWHVHVEGDVSAEDIVAWVAAGGGEARYVTGSSPVLTVRTVNGWVRVAEGHYVIRGGTRFHVDAAGAGGACHDVVDYYPCDPETFARRWEPAQT